MEIQQIIQRIKPSDALDIYGMNTKMLKKCYQTLSEPLADIINACFEGSRVPAELKVARVSPIFKSGKTTLPDNYRPISVLPTISKVLEAAILTRLTSFLKKYNILSGRQFGFREGRTTVDAILSILDSVWEALESGEDCAIIVCDLSKAFDCMQRNILLQKLERHGVRGTMRENPI